MVVICRPPPDWERERSQETGSTPVGKGTGPTLVSPRPLLCDTVWTFPLSGRTLGSGVGSEISLSGV